MADALTKESLSQNTPLWQLMRTKKLQATSLVCAVRTEGGKDNLKLDAVTNISLEAGAVLSQFDDVDGQLEGIECLSDHLRPQMARLIRTNSCRASTETCWAHHHSTNAGTRRQGQIIILLLCGQPFKVTPVVSSEYYAGGNSRLSLQEEENIHCDWSTTEIRHPI